MPRCSRTIGYRSSLKGWVSFWKRFVFSIRYFETIFVIGIEKIVVFTRNFWLIFLLLFDLFARITLNSKTRSQNSLTLTRNIKMRKRVTKGPILGPLTPANKRVSKLFVRVDMACTLIRCYDSLRSADWFISTCV